MYLIYGGIKALDALQIAEIYHPSHADDAGKCERLRKVKLLWCLEQNARATLLRTNAVSVSYRAIRNGVVCLAVLILLIAFRVLIMAWDQKTLPQAPSGRDLPFLTEYIARARLISAVSLSHTT